MGPAGSDHWRHRDEDRLGPVRRRHGTIALTTIFEEGPQGGAAVRWVRSDRLRLVSADELTAFAEAAGLRVETLAGGYDLEPHGPGSERAVLVAIRT